MRVVHALYFSSLAHAPGPAINKVTELPLRILNARLQRNERIFEWHQKYGPVVVIAPGQVSFSSVPVAKEIYSVTAKYPKSSYFDSLLLRRCIHRCQEMPILLLCRKDAVFLLLGNPSLRQPTRTYITPVTHKCRSLRPYTMVSIPTAVLLGHKAWTLRHPAIPPETPPTRELAILLTAFQNSLSIRRCRTRCA